MSLSSLFSLKRRRPQATRPELQSATIELIYAANAMKEYLTVPTIDGVACVCGAPMPPPPGAPLHHNFCPVARFNAAVDAVRQQAS